MSKGKGPVFTPARRQGHPAEGMKVECTQCKTVPYPRGFDVKAGLCWTCSFPRKRHA